MKRFLLSVQNEATAGSLLIQETSACGMGCSHFREFVPFTNISTKSGGRTQSIMKLRWGSEQVTSAGGKRKECSDLFLTSSGRWIGQRGTAESSSPGRLPMPAVWGAPTDWEFWPPRFLKWASAGCGGGNSLLPQKLIPAFNCPD